LPADLAPVEAFVVAVVCALGTVPAAAWLANRLDFHDNPGLGHKQHSNVTPYLGGAGVLVAFFVAVAMSGDGLFATFGWVFLGAVLLWAVGTADDRNSLGAGIRVFAEVALAAVLWAAGLGWHIFDADALNLVFTLLWVVGLVNAFNLMDNLDGAAASVATACLVGIGVTALVDGVGEIATVAAALAGALVGFLRMNLSRPARIFLGDGGSMPVGFAVAALVMALPMETATGTSGLLAGALLVGVPLLDVTLVTVSRHRAGVPIALGGRDHLTHRIYRHVGCPRRVCGVLSATQLLLTVVAFVLLEYASSMLQYSVGLSFVLLGAATVALLEGPGWAPERPPIAAGERDANAAFWNSERDAAVEAF
jgi:UDP-GlcNAc:undecaprenyl-phosphate GlcNAc-1-phosphate transferase